MSIRLGRLSGELSEHGLPGRASLIALLPVLLLLPLVVLDMGLFLVMLMPIGLAAFLAAGRALFRSWRGGIVPAVVLLVVGHVLATKVLFPNVEDIRRAPTHQAKAAAFEQMGRLYGVAVPLVGESVSRTASRGIATRNQELAEELLMSAAPGRSLDLLKPSIEQIWGARAYAQAGVGGAGLGRAIVGDRGVAAAVSYAENSYSVYVLAEHGWLGGVAVLSAYLLLTVAVAVLIWQSLDNDGPLMRATRALFLVAVLILVIPAVYVALSNVAAVPITGQNMPFLGLNAWSDVAVCAGMLGILVTGAIRNAEGTA